MIKFCSPCKFFRSSIESRYLMCKAYEESFQILFFFPDRLYRHDNNEKELFVAVIAIVR